MPDTSYNGWSNRETWLVNLWNEFETKDELDMIKDDLETSLSEVTSDILRDFIDLNAINWDELATTIETDDEGQS